MDVVKRRINPVTSRQSRMETPVIIRVMVFRTVKLPICVCSLSASESPFDKEAPAPNGVALRRRQSITHRRLNNESGSLPRWLSPLSFCSDRVGRQQ